MKNLLAMIAIAIVFVSFSVLTGCDTKEEPGKTADTAAAGSKMEVDTTAKGTNVKVEPKTHDFVGTATNLDAATMMVTIKHGKIDDYKEASSSQFKLSDASMAEYVELNTPVNYTVEVVGDQALIIGMETADADDMPADTAK